MSGKRESRARIWSKLLIVWACHSSILCQWGPCPRIGKQMNEQGKNEGRNMTETKISPESGWAESDCSINYVDLLSPQGWSRPPGIIHLVPLHNQDLVSRVECKIKCKKMLLKFLTVRWNKMLLKSQIFVFTLLSVYCIILSFSKPWGVEGC